MNVDTKTLTTKEAACLLFLLRRGESEGVPWPERSNLRYFVVDHCIEQAKDVGKLSDPTVKSLLSKLKQQTKEE